MEQYEGHLEHLQSQTMGLSKRLCASHMVSYSFTATKTSGSGSNADIQFYSSTSTGPTDFLFQRNAVALPSATVSLPFGHGLLNPYRVTAGITARPAYFVVTSRAGPLDFTVHAQVIDRNQPCQVEFPFVPCLPSAEYNTGGLSMADATEIELGETIRGNVHNREGNILNKGGQWFKFTILPGQAVSASGTVLGGPIWGSSFGMQLWNAAGTQLGSLGTQHAVNGVFEFPLEATFNYISTYTHTGTTPQTIYLQVYGQVGITHEFIFRVREVMMKFAIISQMIDPANRYSEDTVVQVESVWGPNGESLTNYSNTVIHLTETQDTPIYSQNGGSWPLFFRLSKGKGEFLVRSLAGPEQNPRGKPKSSEIVTVFYRALNPEGSISIPQWWTPSENPQHGTAYIHSKADHLVPAWMQKRLLDYESNVTHPDLVAVLAKLHTYKLVEDPDDLALGVASCLDNLSLPVRLNPFKGRAFRIGEKRSLENCGMALLEAHSLISTYVHEARHCYQGFISRADPTRPFNDRDTDFLPRDTTEIVSPDSIIKDSTNGRVVCDQLSEGHNQLKFDFVYSGDSVFDPKPTVVYALEFDAYCMESRFADGQGGQASALCSN